VTVDASISTEQLLRELAAQVLGTIVRRYRNFAAAADAVSRSDDCCGDEVAEA
jgi:hypothetical protein